MSRKKAIKNLKMVDNNEEHVEKNVAVSSQPQISGLPQGKDLLNSSNEELDSMKIDNQQYPTSLTDLQIIDGKDRDEENNEIKKIRDLEELLGFKEMNPYGTLNKAVFEDRLAVMSLSEMYTLASRIGLPASTFNNNRSLLKKSLLKSFDHYAQKHNVTIQGQAKPLIDKTSPNYDSVVRLFNE